MKKIKFFLVVFIFTISMLVCGIKSSAESELIDTDWAVDVFNKTLDNGIGRFICKVTDKDSPIKDYQVSSYYVFEYLRNDAKNPLCDKYVLISKYNVPEFVYSGLENDEIIYGIHDGYWTQAEISRVKEKISVEVLLEYEIQANMFETRFMYLRFPEIQVDYITSIHIKYWMYYQSGIFIFKKWKSQKFERIIYPESVDVIYEDNPDFTSIGIVRAKWDGESLLQTLDNPRLYEGYYFTHRVIIYDGVHDKDYYFGERKDSTKTIEICDMTYETEGLQYYADNLDISKLYIISGQSKDDVPENGCVKALKLLGMLIVLFIILYILIEFYKHNNDNKQKKQE